MKYWLMTYRFILDMAAKTKTLDPGFEKASLSLTMMIEVSIITMLLNNKGQNDVCGLTYLQNCNQYYQCSIELMVKSVKSVAINCQTVQGLLVSLSYNCTNGKLKVDTLVKL